MQDFRYNWPKGQYPQIVIVDKTESTFVFDNASLSEEYGQLVIATPNGTHFIKVEQVVMISFMSSRQPILVDEEEEEKEETIIPQNLQTLS